MTQCRSTLGLLLIMLCGLNISLLIILTQCRQTLGILLLNQDSLLNISPRVEHVQ